MSTMKPSDEIRSRYWDTNDRLSDARLAGNERRVELLTYGAELLAKEYRAAKAKEPSLLFGMMGEAFQECIFPTLRKIAPLLLLLAMLASCSMRTSAIAGTWTLPGEHPAEVPGVVTIAIGQDSARISAVTGNEVLIARYYFDGRGILVPLAGNPNLWVVEKYPGHRISLTDSVGNVAVYSRATVEQ